MIKRKNATGSHAKQKNKKSIVGSSEKPRLTVYRSLNHIYAQIIDDADGRTLVSASSCDPGLKDKLKSGGNIEAAKMVGQAIAERAKAIPIELVVFDRGGRLYHGRVKALADAARSGGLKF
jgi:large subunit ribosomal protein L18